MELHLCGLRVAKIRLYFEVRAQNVPMTPLRFPFSPRSVDKL